MKTSDIDTFDTAKQAFKTADNVGKRGAGAAKVEAKKAKDKLTGGRKDGASKTKEAAKPASEGNQAK